MCKSETFKTESVNTDTLEHGDAGECCLCGKAVQFLGDDHDAAPLKPGERCCGDCNENRVIPERMKLLGVTELIRVRLV